MSDRLSGISLLNTPLDLCQKQQTFHGIFDGGVIGQIFNRMNQFFLCCHLVTLARYCRVINPFISAANVAVDRHSGAGLAGDAFRIPGQPKHGAEPPSSAVNSRACTG
ncbi:MAG: hypothetical protein ABIJ53_08935, partial [Verrucomicrobiota bacterium]